MFSPKAVSESPDSSFLELGVAGASSPASDNFVLGRDFEQAHREPAGLSTEVPDFVFNNAETGATTGSFTPRRGTVQLEEVLLCPLSEALPPASPVEGHIEEERHGLDTRTKVSEFNSASHQLVTRQDLDNVERRLEPIEVQMEAMRKEMHRSAREVAAEVRALTERLTAPAPAAPSVSSLAPTLDGKPTEQEPQCNGNLLPRQLPHQQEADHPSSSQLQLRARRLEEMEQALAVRELALLERERSQSERAEHQRPDIPQAFGAVASSTAPGREAHDADAPTDLGLRRQLAEASEELQANAEERLRLKRHIAQLQETVQQQEFELSSRPTHRLVQQLRNEITRLEKELHPEREALRRVADTRELIRRDRRGLQQKQSIARRATETLQPFAKVSREELERVVTSICGSLGLADCRQADAAVCKMAEVVEERLPRLEKFASQVLDLVAEARGRDARAHSSPVGVDEALEELRAWRAARRGSGGESGLGEDARRLRTSLASELRQRHAGAESRADFVGAETSDAVLLQHVAELVDKERHSAEREALFKQAEHEMHSDPQQTLHRILRHFMQLFEVRSLEGCLPTMNALFTRMSELDTLYGAICDHLHLTGPVKPRVAEVIRALERHEKGSKRSPARWSRVTFCSNS
mmetsp:Transcript_77951/g.138097  ORF Transcript_77951/g.138097 Transcript_77951/m.138097 type:complete len:643 (-) Transcript_77951:151-2079(-)